MHLCVETELTIQTNSANLGQGSKNNILSTV